MRILRIFAETVATPLAAFTVVYTDYCYALPLYDMMQQVLPMFSAFIAARDAESASWVRAIAPAAPAAPVAPSPIGAAQSANNQPSPRKSTLQAVSALPNRSAVYLLILS